MVQRYYTPDVTPRMMLIPLPSKANYSPPPNQQATPIRQGQPSQPTQRGQSNQSAAPRPSYTGNLTHTAGGSNQMNGNGNQSYNGNGGNGGNQSLVPVPWPSKATGPYGNASSGAPSACGIPYPTLASGAGFPGSTSLEENPNGATDPGSCPAGYARTLTPESLLGDGCIDLWHNHCDKARSLPGFLSTSPMGTIIQNNNDYNMVGVVGQLRAVIEQLFALGVYTSTTTPGVPTADGAVMTLNSPTTVGIPTIGVRLRWGVQLNNYAPFEMTIATLGFTTLFGAQPVDRNLTVTVTGANGGVLYIPLAQRFDPGMSMAQNVVGYAPAVTTITISGLPPVVAAAFSASVQLLSAFHPNVASFVRGLRGLDGPPTSEEVTWMYNQS